VNNYQRVGFIPIIDRFSVRILCFNQSPRKNLGLGPAGSSSVPAKNMETVSPGLSGDDPMPWARVSELMIGMLPNYHRKVRYLRHGMVGGHSNIATEYVPS